MSRSLSAVVCTRDRPQPIAETVRLLLSSEGDELELIVMDQSDGRETEAALAQYRADSRLRYVRSTTRGKGAALNEAMALTSSSIVVCTDDDCHAPAGWVSGMTRSMHAHPEAVIIFCQVLPAPHEPSRGYIPTYEFTDSRLLSSFRDICKRGLGLGAGMAVNRDFVVSAGGFDEAFGPGGRFPSADEWNLAIRALLMGRCVYEAADVSIVHDGFRTFEQGRTHIRRDWLAVGAVCALPLRAGYLKGIILPIWLLTTRAAWPLFHDVITLRSARGLGRITAFMKGFFRGLGTPVDKKTLRYIDRRKTQRSV
ncbi:MAG: glycosyltransferase family A protein [Pseudomonadota bacterium]